MSRRMRMVLIGVGLLLVAVIAWFLLLSPMRGDIAALDTQIEQQRTELSSAQVQLAQAETTREEGRKNQARVLELAKMMPTAEEIPSLLLQIQDLAEQSGIDFVAITPGDSTASKVGDYRGISLDLEFTGTYFNVSDFIYRAENMVAGPGRLLTVKDLSLDISDTGAGGGVSPNLNANITIFAFMAGGGESAAPPAATPATGDTTATTAPSGAAAQ
jgi:type IV pilus assembly protein PilO